MYYKYYNYDFYSINFWLSKFLDTPKPSNRAFISINTDGYFIKEYLLEF